MQRSESLQALRGLAALLVTVGHAFYFPFHLAGIDLYDGRTLDQITGGFFEPFALFKYLPSGMFPVAVFFLLSGYVIEISLRRLTPTAFLISRVFRIYPTFFVIFALYLVVYAALGRELPSLSEGLSDLFLVGSYKVVIVAWTLLFEVRYYLAMGLLALIGISGPWRPLAILAGYLAFGSDTGFWLGYMSIGALIYHARSDRNREGFAAMALIAGAFAWYFGANSLHGWPTKDHTSELGAALATFVSS